MRAWKSAVTDPEKIFLYFQEHADKFFTEDHVAAQVKIGRRRTRKIVGWLTAEAKLESVDTVSSFAWGRPKRMFRANRAEDSILQVELFRDGIAAAGFGDPYG